MKSAEQVANDRVERLTRQLLDAQIEQLEAQLEGLKTQREYLNGRPVLEKEPSKRGQRLTGERVFPMAGGAADKILKYLAKHSGPAKFREIADAIGVRPNVSGTALSKLRSKGYVKKAPGGGWVLVENQVLSEDKKVKPVEKVKPRKKAKHGGGQVFASKGSTTRKLIDLFGPANTMLTIKDMQNRIKGGSPHLVSVSLTGLKQKGFVRKGKQLGEWIRTEKQLS